MGVGRIYTKVALQFRHGIRVAYYRDVVRRRILKTKPVEGISDKKCEIHVLTSSADFLNLIWALKSFYHYSEVSYTLCIHDDGSLGIEHIDVLANHFPGARIISRQQADQEVLPTLEKFPHSYQFRKQNHLAPKLFDFIHYLESDRMLLLDSDILFFSKPQELIHRIEDRSYRWNTVNADVQSSYTVAQTDVLKQCGFSMIDRFNSGLGLIQKESIRLEWIEAFLQLPDVMGHFWRIEQTLFALCSSKYGVELLPESYDVFLQGGKCNLQSRHYVGAIRHLMYKEGMRQLVQRGFLKQIS